MQQSACESSATSVGRSVGRCSACLGQVGQHAQSVGCGSACLDQTAQLAQSVKHGSGSESFRVQRDLQEKPLHQFEQPVAPEQPGSTSKGALADDAGKGEVERTGPGGSCGGDGEVSSEGEAAAPEVEMTVARSNAIRLCGTAGLGSGLPLGASVYGASGPVASAASAVVPVPPILPAMRQVCNRRACDGDSSQQGDDQLDEPRKASAEDLRSEVWGPRASRDPHSVAVSSVDGGRGEGARAARPVDTKGAPWERARSVRPWLTRALPIPPAAPPSASTATSSQAMASPGVSTQMVQPMAVVPGFGEVMPPPRPPQVPPRMPPPMPPPQP